MRQMARLGDDERFTERSFDHIADRTEAVATRLLKTVIHSAGARVEALIVLVLGVLECRWPAAA